MSLFTTMTTTRMSYALPRRRRALSLSVLQGSIRWGILSLSLICIGIGTSMTATAQAPSTPSTPSPSLSFSPTRTNTPTFEPTKSQQPTGSTSPTLIPTQSPGPSIVPINNSTSVSPTWMGSILTSDLPSSFESAEPSPSASSTSSSHSTSSFAPSFYGSPFLTPSDVPSIKPFHQFVSDSPSVVLSQSPSIVVAPPPTSLTSIPSDLPSGMPFAATPLPSDRPSDVPSAIATQSPTQRAFSDMPSHMPSRVPVIAPTRLASDMPSVMISMIPTVMKVAPSAMPSDHLSLMPSQMPSLVPTNSLPTPIPSVDPTNVGATSTPTVTGTPVSQTLTGITIRFNGVGSLTKNDIAEWESVTEDWFNEYYNGSPTGSTTSRRRRDHRWLQNQQQQQQQQSRSATINERQSLQQQQEIFEESWQLRVRRQLQTRDARGMQNNVTLTNQAVDNSGNTITYNQKLQYALIGSDSPEMVARRPFESVVTNTGYAVSLRQSINAFQNVVSPIALPKVPGLDNGDGDGNGSQQPDNGNGDGGGLSTGAIAGIAAGGAVLLLGVGYFGYKSMSGRNDHSGYVDPGTHQPISQFNVSASDDISAIDDPTVGGGGKLSSDNLLGSGGVGGAAGGDASVAGYGDQSVATVDYDYSKAYGGAGDTSVVSSAGGTMGDNTRHTAAGEAIAASAATRSALGASYDNEGQFRDPGASMKEEVIEIIAPAGKLGVVIDTPDDGAPVVHAVKDSSIIADQIQVGDKLVAVDDEDVRSMTAIKVSKLISKKSANPARKLTIIRSTLLDDPEG